VVSAILVYIYTSIATAAQARRSPAHHKQLVSSMFHCLRRDTDNAHSHECQADRDTSRDNATARSRAAYRCLTHARQRLTTDCPGVSPAMALAPHPHRTAQRCHSSIPGCSFPRQAMCCGLRFPFLHATLRSS
jgi:hypothetical protein